MISACLPKELSRSRPSSSRHANEMMTISSLGMECAKQIMKRAKFSRICAGEAAASVGGRPIVVEPNQIVSNRDGENVGRRKNSHPAVIVASLHAPATRPVHLLHRNGDNTGTKTATEPSSGSKHLCIASYDFYTRGITDTTARSIHLLQPFPTLCSADLVT